MFTQKHCFIIVTLFFLPHAKILRVFVFFLLFRFKLLSYIYNVFYRKMNISKVKFDHVCLDPSRQIDLHQQTTWELSHVIKGKGKRITGNHSEPFKAGDTVLIPPGIPHCWKFEKQGSYIENITVQFDMDLLHWFADNLEVTHEILERLIQLEEAIVFTGKTKGLLIHILNRMKGESDAMRMVSLLQILVLIGESAGQKTVGKRNQESDAEQKLKKIKLFIICNFRRELRIDDIAQYVGMNRSALCTFFHKHESQTIMKYVVSLRLEEAKRLLLSSSLSNQQVCYKSGFQDVPHFCRTFKQTVGMTPSEYRRNRG